MVRVFIGVRCCDCSKFQAHIQNKKRKFTCKICGKKQSIRKIYVKSNRAQDVTPIIQQLSMQSHILDAQEEMYINENENSPHREDPFDVEEVSHVSPPKERRKQGVSKWSQFLEEPPAFDMGDDDTVFCTHEEMEKQRQRNKKRKAKENTKNRKRPRKAPPEPSHNISGAAASSSKASMWSSYL